MLYYARSVWLYIYIILHYDSTFKCESRAEWRQVDVIVLSWWALVTRSATAPIVRACLFSLSNGLLSLSLENLITRRSSFKGCLFSRLLGKVFYRLFIGWTVKVSHLNGGVISAIQLIHKHNCINHHVSNLINTKSNLRVVLEFMLLCLFFVGSRHWIPVIKLIIPN